jgi:steroid delta-isomerase-like uncharacterized protein
MRYNGKGVVIMQADTTTLVGQLLDAWNTHDADRAATFYAPDYLGFDIAYAAPQRGPQDVRRNLMRYLEAFPDLHFTGTTIVQDNRAVLIWTAHGTHLGTLLHIPPTGRQITVQGVSILTIVGAQITRGEFIWDLAGLLRALRLLPELPSAAKPVQSGTLVQ